MAEGGKKRAREVGEVNFGGRIFIESVRRDRESRRKRPRQKGTEKLRSIGGRI